MPLVLFDFSSDFSEIPLKSAEIGNPMVIHFLKCPMFIDFLSSIGTLLRAKLEIRPMPAPMRSAPTGASALPPGTISGTAVGNHDTLWMCIAHVRIGNIIILIC